jgi:hypothetical protein
MDKNNFLMYKDFKSSIDILSDEQAGKLIKAVFNYVNGRVEPNFKDGMLIMAFNILKTQLERDLESYKKRVKASQENGKLGGRPPNDDKPKEPKKPSGLKKTNSVAPKPRKGDSVSVSDKDSVNVIDKKDKKKIVYFENESLNNLFNDFLKQRKSPKVKNTKLSIGLLLNKLKPFSDEVKTEMINNSIVSGWASVFELKSNGYTKQDKEITLDEVLNINGYEKR